MILVLVSIMYGDLLYMELNPWECGCPQKSVGGGGFEVDLEISRKSQSFPGLSF